MATSFRRRARVLPGALLWWALSAASPLAAQVVTQAEALRLAFPGAQLERRTAFLEPAQLARARSLAGRDVELAQRVVSYYLASRDGRPQGIAYFDSHRVRTLPEVIMVVVDPESKVRRVEVLKFAEPPEYRAPERWLRRFEDRRLAPALSLKADVVNITGATLTAQAVTRAVRRVLALHAVIAPFEARP